MPLRKNNTRTFTRKLFAGETYDIQLYHRDDDQREGVVTVYWIFKAWRTAITKTGEPIAGAETSNHTVIWFIPRDQMARNGIDHINAADRILVQEEGGPAWWEPESTTQIYLDLWSNYYKIVCLRTDPPGP